MRSNPNPNPNPNPVPDPDPEPNPNPNPNPDQVIKLYEIYDEPKKMNLVMELVTGGT